MSLEQVKQLISYIKDDAYIASYVGEGWNAGRVRRVREKCAPIDWRKRAGTAGDDGSHGEAIGHGSNLWRDKGAEEGSRKLLEALLAYYERRAA
jgi:hypothetical protein